MKATPKRKIKTVKDSDYSPLEIYCIKLNEYFKALRVAGFNESCALTIMMDKASHPNWFMTEIPSTDTMEDED